MQYRSEVISINLLIKQYIINNYEPQPNQN